MKTVKEMREELGLSQNQFARLMDIPVHNIQKWEQGITNPPEYVLRLINKVFEMEIEGKVE